MKPVDHYNMLADAHDVGYQPEDALFVQYLNLILDQEDEMLEDENMLQERNYVNVTPEEVVDKQEHLSNQQKGILKETLPKAFRREDWSGAGL